MSQPINKKPTLMQIKQVLHKMIEKQNRTSNGLIELNYIFDAFIEFSNSRKAFETFLTKKIKKDKENHKNKKEMEK